MTNEEKFRKVYTRKLSEAIAKHPEDYMWPTDATVETVVDRMIVAVKRKSFSSSSTIKATAKECGIVPQTMQNITDYVLGKLEVINVSS